jgi:DNA-binding response OmpR family regulator
MAGTPHILVVDDDPKICSLLKRFLSGEGFLVSTAGNGTRMRRLMADKPVDLVILDLVLPGEDGFEIARSLRGESEIGIVMLTTRDDTFDQVTGLEIGADDYVPKPFDLHVLLARVRSVLRRRRAQGAAPKAKTRKIANFAGWRLDFVAQELTSPVGEPVRLTTAEYKLLAVLVHRAGEVLDRDELLSAVAERRWTPYDRSIDVLIGQLRQKIEADPKYPRMIKTVRNAGYTFVADVEP